MQSAEIEVPVGRAMRVHGDRRFIWEAIPTPITTKKPVQNLPKSTIALPELSIKSSGFAHLPHIQFGRGAITYVATTRSVR